MENRTLTLTDAMLTITRRSNLNIDIAKVADVYEEWMKDNLDDVLAVDLDLPDKDVDYILNDEKLMNTVLALVKAEMFARITEANDKDKLWVNMGVGAKKR